MSYLVKKTTLLVVGLLIASPALGGNNNIARPIDQRYKDANVSEVPNFQRHVVPLISRLGCNGRACHGSFQGQGGFRLSLFGYDFKADHDSLLDKENPRVSRDDPKDSMILNKPTSADEHEGGERFKKGGWEYHVLRRWIEEGAHFDVKNITKLTRLDITPREVLFGKKGQQTQLKVVAVWADGSQEDVTKLCRFKTNSGQVASVDGDGKVTAAEPGDTHIVVAYDKAVVPIPVIRPRTNLIGDKYPKVPTPTAIDKLVVQKLRKLGIVPSDLASDAEFLRRVSLDLTGTLPTADEVKKFLADKSADKRAKKIDELLKSPAYAAWWTTKICDFTGNNDQQLNNSSPIRGRAGQEWYDWIYDRVKKNVSYDQIAEGIVMGSSRQSGESYKKYCEEMTSIYRDGSDKKFSDRETMPYYWMRRNFQQPQDRAIGFAYTFLGIRIQCAQCHKHPFDKWSKQDFASFQQFFPAVQARAGRVSPESQKEYNSMVEKLGLKGKRGNELRKMLPKLLKDGKTIPFYEVYAVKAKKPEPVKKTKKGKRRPRRRGRVNAPLTAKILGGDKIDLTEFEDPRKPLMDWLRSPNNPYFAKAFVNRVWASYFNVGIVSPPDDLSLGNPPSNAALLDYLAKGFVKSGFDMKWLHREILNSRTYQLSWRPNETNLKDEVNFSHSIPRRLPAEVTYDAIVMATAADAKANEMRSELKGRAISLPTSSARGRNTNRGMGYALGIFGRSIRESNCDCDRSEDASLLQTVYLQNDNELMSLMDRRGTGWLDEVTGGKARGATNRRAPRPPKNYAVIYKRLADRLKQAKKSKNKKQIKQLQAQLNRYKSRFGKPKGTPAESKSNSSGFKLANAEIVQQAFLRTLSRYPTDAERQRSEKFLTDATDKVEGVRGLLWALLNTKEFIVNH